MGWAPDDAFPTQGAIAAIHPDVDGSSARSKKRHERSGLNPLTGVGGFVRQPEAVAGHGIPHPGRMVELWAWTNGGPLMRKTG